MKNLKEVLRTQFLILSLIFAILMIFTFEARTGFIYFSFHKSSQSQKKQEDPYIGFIMEIYDKIKENYWQKENDQDLSKYFKEAIEVVTRMSQPELHPKNKNGLEKVLKELLKGWTNEKKREFTIQLSQVILSNLEPKGRNALYTTKSEEELKNRVNNINPKRDLYKTLGVNKGASKREIKEEFEKKQSALKKQKSKEAKEKLKELKYAYDVLSDEKKRLRYDKLKVEPTVFSKLLSPEIFYIYIKKFSPNTFQELKEETQKVDKGDKLDTLIIDIRNNIGGAIDLLPYILGPFIGKDQYAYEIYHQGEKKVFKTKTGWLPSLVRYKKVIILINKNTQSTAELFAATLKKYNVGVLVGETTNGWGTIERVFPLEHQFSSKEKYSIFLVHSLTLREDGLPIQGRGVDPNVNISNPNWKRELYSYFHYQKLIDIVDELLKNPPYEF